MLPTTTYIISEECPSISKASEAISDAVKGIAKEAKVTIDKYFIFIASDETSDWKLFS